LLDQLRDLALDLTWTWEPRIRRAFEVLDPTLWAETGGNPTLVLARLGPDGLERALAWPEVRAAIEDAIAASRQYHERKPAFHDAGAALSVGYFSLEFGLTDVLPIFSGGLGVLAGDHLKAASDLGLPVTGVGLLYRQGFGRQRIGAAGEQHEEYPELDTDEVPLERVQIGERPLTVEVPIGAQRARAAVWKVRVGRVTLLLLDTDLGDNPPELRRITDRLYVPDPADRLRQEIVLGVGGLRTLRALGIPVNVFHLNEGHSFLVSLELVRELRQARGLSLEEALPAARAGLVFTTHTPVEVGSDRFEPELIYGLLAPYLDEVGFPTERFVDLGRKRPGDPGETFVTTYAALRLADQAVGVSRLHGTVSRRLWKDAWPGLAEGQVPIGAVTNGVHMPSWVAPEIAALLRAVVGPDWWDLAGDDPGWDRLAELPESELWAVHKQLQRRLAAAVPGLDPEAMTIGFSRRFAPYKRAALILSDPDRLGRLLADSDRPCQIVFAGKAHPADAGGKEVLQQVVTASRTLPGIFFVENYDIEVAHLLVEGADVWLNNPRRLLEASGTSGMKAGANGVLNVSVRDGWWEEGYRPDAGWAIPTAASLERPESDDLAEAVALYRLLEREVVPTFYERDADGLPRRWLGMMKASIGHVGTRFSARRMVLDYFGEAYAPAARRVAELALLPDWGG
jgi:starch phosphorylase